MLGGSGRNLDPTTVPETIRKMYNISVRGDPKVVQAAGEFPGNWVENVREMFDLPCPHHDNEIRKNGVRTQA
jgi:hypothetical protein